jgi:hypothetical protein
LQPFFEHWSRRQASHAACQYFRDCLHVIYLPFTAAPQDGSEKGLQFTNRLDPALTSGRCYREEIKCLLLLLAGLRRLGLCPMKNFPVKFAALALACIVSMQASAQFGGGMGGGRRGPSQGQYPGGGTGRPAPVSRVEQATSQLYDLRMRLVIMPEQAAAWEAFYARYFDMATAPTQAPADGSQPSALQSMQHQLSVAQNRHAMAENLQDATKTLYAKLTPEQQRTADEWIPKLVGGPGADGPSRPF